MRLLAGFVLVLVTIASVQSNPIISQVNNLDEAIASLPLLQNLNNQLNDVFVQLSSVLSPVQLQSLQQQAFQLAQNVMNGNVDVNTAANQLFEQLQEYLGSNSPLLAYVQPLVQQFINALPTVLPQLPSNLGKRGATVARSDPLALANQVQPNDLAALIAAYPQYSDLTNQLNKIFVKLSGILSPDQLESFKPQAVQLVQNVLNGNVDINTAANQLLQLLEQYLGSNSPLLAYVQPLVQKFINALPTVLPQLPSNLGKRGATVARSDPFALANQVQPNDLAALIAAYPQYSDLINQLSAVADEITSVLSPDQLQSLGQQASQLGEDVLNGNVDVNTAVNQLFEQLQEYLGSNSQFLANVQPLVEQLVNAVRTVLSQLP